MIVTKHDLKDEIIKYLKIKRYKINIYLTAQQIYLYLPIKSKIIRSLIQEYLKKKLPVSIFIIVLSLKWYQGWFKKIKEII